MNYVSGQQVYVMAERVGIDLTDIANPKTVHLKVGTIGHYCASAPLVSGVPSVNHIISVGNNIYYVMDESILELPLKNGQVR